MQKNNNIYLIPQLVLVVIILTLLVDNSGYIPLNALRSIQLVRTVDSSSAEDNTITTLNLLKRAIVMSPGNCDAYLSLGTKYIDFAFPNIDPKLPDLHEQGKYDDALAAEILSLLDSGLQKCDRYELSLHFLKGYLYYLMNKPQLALQTFQTYLDLKPSKPVHAYEIMSEAYAELQDPLNAGVALIRSMSFGHKDEASQDLIKIDRINEYFQNTPIGIIPDHTMGFGRYFTATKVGKELKLFGTIQGDLSLLVYSKSVNSQLEMQGEILDVGDNIGGSVGLDKDGNTHVVYLFGDQFLVYSNSKDEFTKKIVIDAFSTNPPILNMIDPITRTASHRLDSVDIAVDDQNQSHIIWSYSSGFIGYTTINDGEADKPIIMGSNVVVPDITVLHNGDVSIVYNTRSPFPIQFTQVWYLERKNGVWKDPLQISHSSMWAGAASIVANDEGELHVFFVTGSSPENVQLLHITRNLQGNWSEPEVIGSQNYRPFVPISYKGSPINFGGRTAPAVAMLPNNHLVVVWRGYFANGSTQVLGRLYSNGEWQPIQVLGEISDQDFTDTPSIIDKNNNLDTVDLVWSNNGELVFYEWKP